MNETRTKIIQNLNTLLQGCHMISNTFKEYLEQTESINLKSELNHALTIFHHHEIALINHIHLLDATATIQIQLSIMMMEFFEKIKAQFATHDRERLGYAISCIDMGLKSCQDFTSTHCMEPPEILGPVTIMEKDYKELYKRLIELR